MNTFDTELVPITAYLKLPRFVVPSFLRGMDDLTKEANERQPPKPGEFTKRAAAIHEVSHCVVARLEGEKPKSASIWQKGDAWLGEYLVVGKGGALHAKGTREMLAHVRTILAGRRGELLFEPNFCLRAGLEELAYAQLLTPIAIRGMGLDIEGHCGAVWGTTLSEVDETLRKYEPIVQTLADRLMTTGKLDRWQLAKHLSAIEERKSLPPIRYGNLTPALDPLA